MDSLMDLFYEDITYLLNLLKNHLIPMKKYAEVQPVECVMKAYLL